MSLHPSFPFDIAAIHGRNGELHASVGVGRVLATLELVWYDDTMYVQCDRRLDRLLGNDQKCFGSFRGGSMVGILVLGIQVPGSGNIKHQTVDRHSMSRSSLDPRGFRFVGTGRLLSILSAAFALRFGQTESRRFLAASRLLGGQVAEVKRDDGAKNQNQKFEHAGMRQEERPNLLCLCRNIRISYAPL